MLKKRSISETRNTTKILIANAYARTKNPKVIVAAGGLAESVYADLAPTPTATQAKLIDAREQPREQTYEASLSC